MAYNSSGSEVLVVLQNYTSLGSQRESFQRESSQYFNLVRSRYLRELQAVLDLQEDAQSVTIVARARHSILAQIMANDTARWLFSSSGKWAGQPPIVTQLVLFGGMHACVSPEPQPGLLQGVLLFDLPSSPRLCEESPDEGMGEHLQEEDE